MGLLTPVERRHLINNLCDISVQFGPRTRDQLLLGFPPRMIATIPNPDTVRPAMVSLLDVVDGPTAQRADGSWPIVWLIENAIEIDPEGAHAAELARLLDTLQARASATKAGESLEGLVNLAAKIANPQIWVDRMAQSMLAVCRVSTPDTIGTGFLVGPSLVMTNYHVVAKALGQAEKLRETKLQFDYRTDSRDRALNKEDQKIYGLAEGEPILSSGASDLDYALLPVDGSPGGDQVATRFGTVRRGWLSPVKQNIEIDSVIFILQHPHGDYLGVAVDRVTKVTANRVQYRTNTNVGSSGSPCFNQDWDLVALHHAGENSARPTWNQGIPFKAILARQEVSDAIARNTDRV